jgi:hypothetical protein
MAAIRWYSTAPDLATRERDVVELPAALKVVDAYFDRLKPGYSTGEEALSETTFGFSRNASDFVEICLHAPGEISLSVEFPPSKGFLGKLRGASRKELSVKSREALKRYVSAYFTMSQDEFKAHIASAHPG